MHLVVMSSVVSVIERDTEQVSWLFTDDLFLFVMMSYDKIITWELSSYHLMLQTLFSKYIYSMNTRHVLYKYRYPEIDLPFLFGRFQIQVKMIIGNVSKRNLHISNLYLDWFIIRHCLTHFFSWTTRFFVFCIIISDIKIS